MSKLKQMPEGMRALLYASGLITVLSLVFAFIRHRRTGLSFGDNGLWLENCGFDYYAFFDRFPSLHSAGFFTGMYRWYYPAPAIFFYYPFYRLGHSISLPEDGFFVFVAVVTAASVILCALFGRTLVRHGLGGASAAIFCVLLVLLSWPLFFAIQRGNIEGLTWMLVAGAVWFYARGKSTVSALLIGVAGSVKFYPILFALLFLRRRAGWRYCLTAVLAAGVTTVVALRFLEPDVVDCYRRESVAVHQFVHDYSEIYSAATWDHSIFGAVKDATHRYRPDYGRELTIYYAVAFTAASLSYGLRVRKLPDGNQILFLSCAAITLPPTSFDYTLLLLYIPIAWLVLLSIRAAHQRTTIRGLTATLASLGFAIGPAMFLLSNRYPGLPGAFTACCLVCLMGVACVFRLEIPGDFRIMAGRNSC